jgi:hypothetical protein
MCTYAEGQRITRDRARNVHRGLRALAVLGVMGAVACGGDESPPPTQPVLPGTISVSTVTSGFMQDDGYELLLDGAAAGAIGANDAMSIPDLDPATYDVGLDDVAANCSAEGASSVSVASEQTATVTLNVTCALGAGTNYTVQFGRERPDLDTGEITVCPFSICSTNEAWDFYVYNSSSSTPHSVIRQNQTANVEIAHVAGVTLDTLTPEDVDGATFTTDLVADPFDADRVILIRTDLGAVYALGNPVEDTTAQTLTFEAVLLGS